jgi:Glyoxalase-like domain
MAVAQGVFVTLDCADPQSLGEFWAAMLGGEVTLAKPTTVMVRTDWMWLAAFQVEDYVAPTWPRNEVPKQIHLDLGVTDLESAFAEAQRLGATPAPFQPAPELRRILFDPAGHPFCLTTQIPREALSP